MPVRCMAHLLKVVLVVVHHAKHRLHHVPLQLWRVARSCCSHLLQLVLGRVGQQLPSTCKLRAQCIGGGGLRLQQALCFCQLLL